MLMATQQQQMKKVKRDKVVACMTCPLCDNLMDEATTISLCLHTFCRKCIYDRFEDEDVCSCPVCDVNLGAIPVEKLRADYNLQALRAKIFPYERKKESAPEVIRIRSTPSPTPSPVNIKERSISSLGVSTQEVSIQSGLTGKGSRSLVKRIVFRRSGIDVDGPIKKKENSAKDNFLQRSAQKERKEHTLADRRTEDVKKNNAEVKGQKTNLWTPLNCLTETISRTNSSKENLQGSSHVTLVQPNNNNGLLDSATKGNGGAAKVYTSRKKHTQRGRKRKVADEGNESDLLPGHEKRGKVPEASWNKDAVSQDLGAGDGASASSRNVPVWFKLVAAKDREREVSLPQISSSYLRVKDGSVPLSFIQKYLAKKLNLSSEHEVEIMCQGHSLLPAVQLHNLVDFWFKTTSTSKRIPVTVGASANDFILVLSYSRKVPAI